MESHFPDNNLHNYDAQLKLIDDLNVRAKNELHKNLISAERAAGEAKNLSENIGYNGGIAEATRQLGGIALIKNRLDDAFQHYRDALSIFKKTDDVAGMAKSYNDLGAVNLRISELSKAAKYFHKSLGLKEKLKDSKGQSNTLLNLGLVYFKQHNTSRALEMYKRSLFIARKLKDENLQAIILNNLGEIFINIDEPAKALKYLFSSVEKLKKFGNLLLLASAYNNIGWAYKDLKNWEKAIHVCSMCLKIAVRNGFDQEMNSAYMNMAEVHIGQNDLKKAIKVLSEIQIRAKKAKNISLLQGVYIRFSILYEKMKDYKQALEFFKKHKQIEMKLLSQENLKQINELGIKYEVDKREKEKEIFRLKNVELKDTLDKLNAEKKRSDSLLKNILPVDVAEDLKNKGKSPVRYFESVSVMFIDIKDFTLYSEKLSPSDLVKELDYCFMKFDEIIEKHKLEKIKTIGDAYLCAGGLPKKSKDHAIKMVNAAIDIRNFIAQRMQEKAMTNQEGYEVRIGIHSGSVIAGIIGTKKFAYDIWGDTVNTANRMEQSSEAGKINISESTYQLIKSRFKCTYRGKLPAKNKGDIDMYFVNA